MRAPIAGDRLMNLSDRLQYDPDLPANLPDGRFGTDTGHLSNLLRYSDGKVWDRAVSHRSPSPPGGRQCSSTDVHKILELTARDGAPRRPNPAERFVIADFLRVSGPAV
jgi:hypothetical protein